MTTSANPDLEQHLSIAVDQTDEEVVLSLGGELDPHSAPHLLDEIDGLDASGVLRPIVVLDLGELTFIDSSGLRVVISAQKTLTAEGHRFVLRNPSETTRRLLEITGLVEHLEIES